MHDVAVDREPESILEDIVNIEGTRNERTMDESSKCRGRVEMSRRCGGIVKMMESVDED